MPHDAYESLIPVPAAALSHGAPNPQPALQGRPDEPTGTLSPGHAPRPRPRTWLLALTMGILLLTAALYQRQVAGQEARRRTMQSQLVAMRESAARLMELEQKPQAVLARMRSSEEFLGTVEQALAGAGVARDRWQDSIPQPLARVTGTDYQRQATLLYFDALNLEQVAAFVCELSRLDTALGVSSLGLTARDAGFDVEIAVSYRVYSPRRE